MVRAVLLWNPAKLPECLLDPLSQGLKGFAKAQTDRLGIGVREHQVVDHMRKRLPSDGDPQIFHMGEIRLRPLSGLVPLLKNDFLFWPMHRSPSSNVSL